MKSKPQNRRCPCGSKKPYSQCCEPLHHGAPASDAEALMRSRYAAFALGLDDYIRRSWHSSTRPHASETSHRDRPQWIGLQIRRYEQIDCDHAVVEFVARYKINGRAFVLHEVSRFVCENNHWLYVDGDIMC
ncbi:MAG TPA: YchJ family metal-binding protein [Spongiibacteraceae bacterium]|nr:YchJ family metal-binding protein [Spongiibacteraceae bacterium]